MLISVISPKGGVGTSTISALFGVALSKNSETLLIDGNNGDLHGICAVQDEADYSFSDWVESNAPDERNLSAIGIQIDRNLSLVVSRKCIEQRIHHPKTHIHQTCSNELLVESIVKLPGHCIIDLGLEQNAFSAQIVDASDVVVMVVRQCYLSMLAAMGHPYLSNVDACVVVQESGRTIPVEEISSALNVNCMIEVQARRDYAKVIDAGVLIHRAHKTMISPVNAFVQDVLRGESRDAMHNSEQRIENLRHDLFSDSEKRNHLSFWSNSNEEILPSQKLSSPFISKAKERLGDVS